MFLPWCNSATEMFINLEIHSFDEMLRIFVFSFRSGVTESPHQFRLVAYMIAVAPIVCVSRSYLDIYRNTHFFSCSEINLFLFLFLYAVYVVLTAVCYVKLNFHFSDLRALLPRRDTYIINVIICLIHLFYVSLYFIHFV